MSACACAYDTLYSRSLRLILKGPNRPVNEHLSTLTPYLTPPPLREWKSEWNRTERRSKVLRSFQFSHFHTHHPRKPPRAQNPGLKHIGKPKTDKRDIPKNRQKDASRLLFVMIIYFIYLYIYLGIFILLFIYIYWCIIYYIIFYLIQCFRSTLWPVTLNASGLTPRCDPANLEQAAYSRVAEVVRTTVYDVELEESRLVHGRQLPHLRQHKEQYANVEYQ